MSQSTATKVSRLVLGQLGPRFLSNTTGFSRPTTTGMSSAKFASYGVRGWSASAPSVKPSEEEKPKAFATEDGKLIVSYWGVAPPKITKEDGTAWKWNCFRPWESYTPDVSIDVKKHHKPETTMDKFAYWTVQVLKYPTYLFFQERRHMCHAVLLETVAAVPGMVGGMLLHCKSLRRFEQSGGWIKALLEEAENERMHLMTFIEIAKPKWYERALVFANSSRTWTMEVLRTRPAPAIAIDYWRLPPNSTLRDVVFVIRADEAHHRDLNHYASDIQCQGQELKDTPAPIGYH
ncbi:UBIQUINOL OXIDASE 3 MITOCHONDRIAL [Salix viminalis]|uniref:Ubiquinol oxidase n=1 Tax=Salix viminalis TaxID=40686 RepID=A0A9Q0T7Y5_SALVM|nr:UBIQUINOL OXIDASE 3 MITOCHONDRIAL [Salix viminalis]